MYVLLLRPQPPFCWGSSSNVVLRDVCSSPCHEQNYRSVSIGDVFVLSSAVTAHQDHDAIPLMIR